MPACEAGQLCHGDYKALIRPRGGGGLVGELFPDSLDFTRVVDATSEAGLRIVERADRCAELIPEVEPWEHELHLIRNGDLVWVGPVVDTDDNTDGFSLQARDLTQWLARRFLPFDRSQELDLGLIYRQYVEDAMAEDPSPNIVVNPQPIGLVGKRSVKASQFRIAADEIREIATTGLDYTTVGRDIVLGGIEVPTGTIPTLYDEHVLWAGRQKAGLQATNDLACVGQGAGADGSPLVGRVGATAGQLEKHGLLQRFFSESAIQDQDSCTLAATTRHDLLAPVPRYYMVRPGPTAPLDFNQLVAGGIGDLHVQTGHSRADGTFRLRDLTVTWQAATGDETITCQYEAVGTVSVG